ncbi:MAG TPA: LysR substrate-binding domain-containing protein, partial [Spirochaetia bacterium]|nr:LysR substrate-binding domain-containing protein [Spirochaetia bacterium]
ESAGRRISLETLLTSEIILREPGSGTREVFERYLAARGHGAPALQPLMEIGSNNAIKSLLESELGVSVISRLAVERELREGRLISIRLEGPRITREMRFVWSEYSDLGFVEEFIRFCGQHMPGKSRPGSTKSRPGKGPRP